MWGTEYVNASGVPKNLPPGRCLHMMNHGCDPNGKLVEFVPDSWNDDLVLFVYVTTRDILKGEQVTMAYGGDMWQPLDTLPRLSPRNTRRIECRCADPCPKRLGRFDWIARRSPLTRSTHTRWHHRNDSLISESMDDVGDASQSMDITLEEQIPRLSVGILDVSSLPNLSLVGPTHLAVDRRTQLGTLIENFPSDFNVKEFKQVLLADHKPGQQLIFEGEQQAANGRGGIGEGGIGCGAPEQVCIGHGGARVEPSIFGRSRVGRCDSELSVLVQSGVQSGNGAQRGTVQSGMVMSGIERGVVECEGRALPLGCLQVLGDDGRNVTAVNASPQLSEPTRRQPCQVLEDVYSLPHLLSPVQRS
jgi:hypothetical protein